MHEEAELQVNERDCKPVVAFDYLAAGSQHESNAQWKLLREQCPIGWSDAYGGHWVLSRYADVTSAFRDWETFTSTRSDPMYTPMIIAPTQMGANIPQELDPPEWRPYRQLFTELLGNALANDMPSRISKWVTYYLDRVIESGRMDLTVEFASPVTAAVALEWLGFPMSDWERISRAYHHAVGFAAGSHEFEAAVQDLIWLEGRIAEEVARRREEAQEDVLSAFANAHVNGELVSEEYACSMVHLAIAGGVETTVSATSAALVHLHFNPDDRAALVADPSLMDTAIDEFLRLYPPVRTHGRTVNKDTDVLGCPMRKGDRVLLSHVSANYDEAAFADADRFVIDRYPNRHTSFGVGIHRCPGAAVGRLEMNEMITQVLKRMPDYRVIESELAGYATWGITGGWAKAPVEFTPGAIIG